MCTKEGIVHKTITKKDGEGYKRAKKANCGDAYLF
ncbi:MAG: hypothetical protein UEA60_04595 [Lachnospiraceae bacterium]|nr:hypothetical protein [Lachnospiraceae bacterium]